MKLRVDVNGVTFIAANPPEAVVDFESKLPRTDPDGRPVFAVGVVALGAEGADVLTVKVAGQPKGITQGLPVKVSGLVATTWQMGDRHGVSFRADVIEAVTQPQKTPAS
ncbi:MAG: hypothetical protein M0Z63_10110 [Actinomycetota bacterium]|jgi:hypothetical protein|nr:hypothetical protein [Actinomycetota bacterium]